MSVDDRLFYTVLTDLLVARIQTLLAQSATTERAAAKGSATALSASADRVTARSGFGLPRPEGSSASGPYPTVGVHLPPLSPVQLPEARSARADHLGARP